MNSRSDIRREREREKKTAERSAVGRVFCCWVGPALMPAAAFRFLLQRQTKAGGIHPLWIRSACQLPLLAPCRCLLLMVLSEVEAKREYFSMFASRRQHSSTYSCMLSSSSFLPPSLSVVSSIRPRSLSFRFSLLSCYTVRSHYFFGNTTGSVFLFVVRLASRIHKTLYKYMNQL